MGILFFTKGDISIASSRQRVWRVAERLKKQYKWNYEVIHSIIHSSFSFWPSHVQSLKSVFSQLRDTKYKILFIHKSLFPWDIILLVIGAKKFFGKKLVYDLDDAEWIHSPQKSAMLAKHADAVFCGSHEILMWAKRYAMNCVFVPTSLDVDVYGRHTIQHANPDTVTIGWVGQGKAHFKAGNFRILKDVFSELYRRGNKFRFVVVGSQYHAPLKEFFSGTPYAVVCIDDAEWAKEGTVPKLIQQYQFDIGIMPMENTLFNRAKCAFKALEYMACGVPVVASPIGEANHVIQNGGNGFLADTPEEWISAIERLVLNVSLRRQMGEAGLKAVHDRYSYKNGVSRIYEELVKLQEKSR